MIYKDNVNKGKNVSWTAIHRRNKRRKAARKAATASQHRNRKN